MKKSNCSNEFGSYLIQVYGGMFTGVVFLIAVAGCFGLADNMISLASLAAFSLASASLFFLVNQD